MNMKSMSGVIWITGFSGAGKSTVAQMVNNKLDEMGVPNVLLDGDMLRSVLGDGFGYSESDR
jgi:adenylylsulfate kinase